MKTKIVVVIGLALCTMLLVSPALASDAGTLEIYGNANEDDTIDMRDLTYVKLIFFGKKPETELADAKYDGKINPLDFIQIKLIIVGKEKELTFVDTTGKAITLDYPIERIAVLNAGAGAVITALGAEDKVVGATEQVLTLPETAKTFEDVPSLGTIMHPCLETTIEVDPEVVFAFAACPGARGVAMKFAEDLEYYDIPMAFFSFLPDMDTIRSDTMTMGWLLNEQEKAEEYVDFFENYYNIIEERTKDLSEDEKKQVYMENLDYMVAYYMYQMINIAGGSDIAADVVTPARHVKVAPEWVVKQNPEIILSRNMPVMAYLGHGKTDEEAAQGILEDIKSRPGWSEIDAVKNDEVYLFSLEMATLRAPIGVIYMSKMFYPARFGDVNPDEILREYLDQFYCIEEIPEGILIYPYPW
ncbi:MAG: ABC transporter substrate-binding protein [Euryarchaeota archaeon]|nr:ABC transporter substrate-binding protein [Euryarchaeota archaeon]